MHDASLITSGKNVYFQGDLPRTYENMTDRMSSGHYRLKVHPLNALQTFPPTFVLKKMGLNSFEAVKVVTALISSAWGCCLYVLIRLIGLNRMNALILTLMGFSSSAAFFWLSVPESYGLGSISIMIGLSLAAFAQRKVISDWGYIVISAITLSTTVTNWMVGIFTTLSGNSIKKTINLTLISLSLVTILWGVQKRFFPEAVFFIGDNEESSYIFFPDVERIVSVTNSFIFHTLIAPAVQTLGDNGDGWSMISFHGALPASENIINVAGDVIWISIVAIGLWALFTLKEHLAFRFTLALTLIGQFFLHLLYGEETFLYSLHFLPLLIALAALAMLTTLRMHVAIMILILIPIAATNNLMKFQTVNTTSSSPKTTLINKSHVNLSCINCTLYKLDLV